MKAYILLDRSSSMSGRWNESISALNEYTKNLKKKTEVYVATFASGFENGVDYKVLREEKVKNFNEIGVNEVRPSGMTPLHDASARMIDKAFEDDEKKAILVFITDGEENCSRECNKATIKAKLDEAEKRGWEVLFLGVDFNAVTDQGMGYGLDLSKTLNISVNNMKSEMKGLATRTMAYASAGTRVEFNDEDRMRATKK